MNLVLYTFWGTYILMAVWGVVILAQGVVTISNEYVVKGPLSRWLALILLAAFPVGAGLKFLALRNADKITYQNTWFYYDSFALMASGIAFMALGMYWAPPIDGNPNTASKAEKKTAAQRRAGKK